MKAVLRDLVYPIPSSLRRRHTRGDVERVKAALATRYFQGWRSKEAMPDDVYRRDLEETLRGRIAWDRRFVIPWLNSARPLDGLRVLEIGCGTGPSTVALAEQGAVVTGIDIDPDTIAVARERCAAHNVSATMYVANAESIKDYGDHDLVIYYATFEHMTVDERLKSLSETWSIIPRGGMLAIVETPNRLWFFDEHTSQLPFFHWLPDDLAFEYSRYSPRTNFNNLYREPTPEALRHFLRRGRGASYHEFEIAIAPANELQVVSSLLGHLGWRRTIREPRIARRFKKFLRHARPDLHSGWFEKDLDLIIRKT
jgi:2-polyprenyl-3-methyl-5-hydroxy-6-metoxy-1,4-benzoquinol methylase